MPVTVGLGLVDWVVGWTAGSVDTLGFEKASAMSSAMSSASGDFPPVVALGDGYLLLSVGTVFGSVGLGRDEVEMKYKMARP